MLRGDQAWNKTVKAAMQFPGLFVARKEPPMNRIRIISRCWRSFAADSNDPFLSSGCCIFIIIYTGEYIMTNPKSTLLNSLVPKDETVWVTYYRDDDLLFFLTGPSSLTSSMAAQSAAFTLYAVTDGSKAKKLGKGGDPTALEKKYGVSEAIRSTRIAKAS